VGDDGLELQYAFYLKQYDRRIDSRWYQSDSSAEFQIPHDRKSLQIIAFVKDDAGVVTTKSVILS
jgi:hypothetical protein